MLSSINEFLTERTALICAKKNSVYVVQNVDLEDEEVVLKSENIEDVENLCIEWWNASKVNGLCLEEIEDVEEQFPWLLVQKSGGNEDE